MKPNNQTKVGSILIEGGIVYKVYKVKPEIINGKSEKILYYRPYYKNINNNTLDCSIPESSLAFSNLRQPHTKEEIDKFFKHLSSEMNERKDLDIEDAATILKLNDIYDIAFVIKFYWKESIKDGVTFTKTKSDLLKRAVSTIIEEVAFVMGTSMETAGDKITKHLNSYAKNKGWMVKTRITERFGSKPISA